MEQSHSLFLSFRFEDPSCAFGAALLQGGPTHRADSLSFPFIPPRGIHPAPLARPFFKGLLMERSSLFSFYTASRNPSCAFGAALLQGPTHRADSLSFPFILPRGFILRLWRGPSPRAYSWSGFTLFFFRSASRIHPAPLARPFSKGLLMERIHSLFLSFRLEDSSCAFGAALLHGPTHGAESLSFPFIPLRGIILRLWRAPSSKGYSISKTPFFHLNPSHQSPVTSHQKRKRASLR